MLAAIALGALCRASGADAQSIAGTGPCDSATHHQLDFWIGDWLVYDGDTGGLIATDTVSKTQAGCVVEQDLRFVTDMYRRPEVPYRLAGMSISRFDGEQWLQLWADNQWGAIVMKGVALADGGMEFDTILPSRGRDVRLVWRRELAGAVRILQYVAPTGSGKWQQYGNLLYHLKPTASAIPQASNGASTPCRRNASAKGSRCSP